MGPAPPLDLFVQVPRGTLASNIASNSAIGLLLGGGEMRPILERLGPYLPAAILLALPTVFIPSLIDSFILPRASLVIIGACIGTGLALLLPGGHRLGRLRLPLLAAVAAALLAFAFSLSWPLSLAGAYTRYESLPIRLSYLGLLAVAGWLLLDRPSPRWGVPAVFLRT